MRRRDSARFVAVALFASSLVPVVLPPAPAGAASGCTTVVETDHTATWSDGESVRLRIVRPTGGTGCPGKPTAGWPLIVYMHGYTADRCENMSFASRSTMASWGYAVLSFNGRGGPSAGASACGQLSDAEDALDDNGRDYTGPRDKLDISELIDWVRDNYAPTGCTSNCVNTNAVGLTGFSYGGMRALMMGVGSAANPQFDARVDAIAPVAGGMNWDKVPALSSDGAATPAWRPRATTSAPVWWGHQGWMTHTDEAVMNTALTAERAEFANEAVPSSNGNGSMTAGSAALTISGTPAFTAGDVGSRVNVAGAGASGRTLWTSIALYTSPTEVTLATTASTPVSGARASWGPRGFWDERLFLSGDTVVDKAAHIAVPTLLVHGWLDGTIGTAYAEVYGEIYNRIPGNDRYLYLGSCTHSGSGLSGDPCHQTTNGPRMRDTLHRFFDRYVRGETTNAVRPPGTTTCATTGPCAIYTIPAKWVSSTNNPWYTDNWTEVSRTSWPPSDFTPETRYFRNDGTLSTTWETTLQANTSCSALPPTKGTGCSTFTNDLNIAPTFDVCYGLTYGTTEVQSFDWSFAAEKKVARLEADLHLSSTTSRQQVYVDVWLTDSAGTELTRVWQGSTQIAPVKRDGTPGTVYRFKFRPGTAAWTVAAGQRLRIKVASGYARGLPSEPLPATYTLYHNDPYRSAITLTYVP